MAKQTKSAPHYIPDKQLLLDSIESLKQSLLKHDNKPQSFKQSIIDMIADKQNQLDKHYSK